MITIEHDRESYLVLRVSGRLTRGDYDAAIPELENELELQEDRPRLMIVLEDFRGWHDLDALWQDLKFDFRHGSDFGRVAVVGDSAWEEWGNILSKPFFGSRMKYFDLKERAAACAWLAEDRGGGKSAKAMRKG